MNSSSKALIFGASGQDGIYMFQLCTSVGLEAVRIARSSGFEHTGSVADYSFTENLIDLYRPKYIFHLAANSSTKHEHLFENHETISTGTLNILESVYKHSPNSKVILCGSGLQFTNTGQPISERSGFEANSPYSVARIQSVYAARYFRRLGIKAYIAYLFHHDSPYRKANHLTREVISQIKEILTGKRDKITLRDSSYRKEWGYAKDIVHGIFTLASQDNVFEAAIGTGVSHSIYDFLKECLEQSGLSIEANFESLTPCKDSKIPHLVSDPQTINKLGWHHSTDLASLARILLSASDQI